MLIKLIIKYPLEFHVELLQLEYLGFAVHKFGLQELSCLTQIPQELITVWIRQERFKNCLSHLGVNIWLQTIPLKKKSIN